MGKISPLHHAKLGKEIWSSSLIRKIEIDRYSANSSFGVDETDKKEVVIETVDTSI